MSQDIEAGRKITVHKLFDILQQEYVICLVRAKVYPFEHLKKYWVKTALMKRERIEDIAQKNSLPSIFNDDRVFDAYVDLLVNNEVIPKFYYTSNENRDKQKYWDLFNWFSPGAKVEVGGQSGVIFSIDMKVHKCLVSFDKKEELSELNFEDIKRTDVSISII